MSFTLSFLQFTCLMKSCSQAVPNDMKRKNANSKMATLLTKLKTAETKADSRTAGGCTLDWYHFQCEHMEIGTQTKMVQTFTWGIQL